MNVQTLERCFLERIDGEMDKSVDTVKDKIQNLILPIFDSNITPKIDLAIRSINASSGQDVTSVSANSDRGRHIGIPVPFVNVSKRNNTLHLFNANDETRSNIPD